MLPQLLHVMPMIRLANHELGPMREGASSATGLTLLLHTAVCGGTTWLCRSRMMLNPSPGQPPDE
jgi:hypothetical protein